MQDEEDMKQLSFGHDSAFDALVFRYHKPLYAYVYRLLQDITIAEDMVQETFLNIYQQGRRGFVPDHFKPWMYRIATNQCKDYWKKASTRREFASDQHIEDQRQIHHIIDHQLERKWMVDALNQLSIAYRSVLILRFYQDLTYAEIALTLELPLNTVKTRMARGLKKLEEVLKEDEQKGVGANG